jgi:hypothetical protein
MLDRILTWLSQWTAAAIAFFDHLPRWLQFLLVTVTALAVVAGLHLDDLAREREWRQFRLWRERRRRALELRLPRELR